MNCTITGFDASSARKAGLKIGDCGAVFRCSDGKERLFILHYAILNPKSPITLGSSYQTRENGFIVDDVSKKHTGVNGRRGTHCIRHPDWDYNVPMYVKSALMIIPHRKPTESDLDNLEIIHLTRHTQWFPSEEIEDVSPINPMFSNRAIAQHSRTDKTTTEVDPEHTENEDKLDIRTIGVLHTDFDPAVSSFKEDTEHQEFFDAVQFDLPTDKLWFFDSVSEPKSDEDEYYTPRSRFSARNKSSKAFHLAVRIDNAIELKVDTFIRTHQVDDYLNTLSERELFGMNDPFDTFEYAKEQSRRFMNADEIDPNTPVSDPIYAQTMDTKGFAIACNDAFWAKDEEEFERRLNHMVTKASILQAYDAQPYLAWGPLEVV